MEQIYQFIEQILSERGTTGLSEQTKLELRNTLAQELLDQIDKAAIYALSEEDAIKLAKLTDDPNFTNDDVSQFIIDAGVDLNKVALETMENFRKFYLSQN